MDLRDTRIVVTGAISVIFVSALEQSIVATALPVIMAELQQVELGSWVVTAYLLSSVCATPVFGKLSDMYGRARVLRACLSLFILGSIACALAGSMTALVLSRALQGLGGGGLLTMGQSIIGDAVPPRERGRYAGYFSLVWMSSALLGPVVGGILAEHGGWRWIFWINLPLGALAWLLSARSLARIAPVRREAHVDLVGIVLLSLMSTGLLAAVSLVGRIVAGEVLAVLAVFAALSVASIFVLQQRRVREPIIPPHFLHDAVIAPVLASGFLVYGAYIALTVIAPLYFQVALGRTAAESGLLLVPAMLTSSFTALAAGRYTRTHGRYRNPPLVTLPVAVVSMLLLAWLAPRGWVWPMTVLSATAALGVGSIFPCSMVAAQSAAGPRDIGAVSGAIGLSRSLGAALVTGLAMAWLLAQVQHGIGAASSLHDIERLVTQPLDPQTRVALLNAFATVIAGLAILVALGLLVFTRIEERPLSTVAPHAKRAAANADHGS